MGVVFDDTAQLTNDALMRVLKPIGAARGLPYACYIDPAVLRSNNDGCSRKVGLALGLSWTCLRPVT